MNRKRWIALLAAAVLLLAVAGCGGETDPPTQVDEQHAVLQGKLSCDEGQSGEWWFRVHDWSVPKSGNNFWAITTDRVSFSCPAGGVTDHHVSKTLWSLSRGTHYSYQVCAHLDTPSPADWCFGANGDPTNNPNGMDVPTEDFYTEGDPLALDGGSPDDAVYADHGLELADPNGAGPPMAKKGWCCISGYIVPAPADVTAPPPAPTGVGAWINAAANYWATFGTGTGFGNTCPRPVTVHWINDRDATFDGRAIILGCFATDSKAQMWLNIRGDYNHVNVGGASVERSWCSIVVHEYGHLLGLRHSGDPNSIMYPTIGHVPPFC